MLSFRENTIPSDWEESYIINLFKGQGDALARGNYRGLKLLDQVMKVLERILEVFIREKVNINDMQFGFTTDAIFIVRQMQEKYNCQSILHLWILKMLSTEFLVR